MTAARILNLPNVRTLQAGGALMALIALVCIFALATPSFFTTANVWNVTTQATLLLIVALPMTMVIMTEGLDLSIGAVVSLGTVVFALALKAGVALPAAVALCLLVGGTLGAFNGALVGGLGIPPFVVTLGTMGVAGGFALVGADERDLVGLGAGVTALWNGRLVGVPVPVWVAAALYALLHLALFHARFGMAVVSLGGNREALRLAGRTVAGHLVAVYALAGVCAALASLLLAARIDGGNPTAASGMEFDAIAAVVIGGTSFVKGRGTLFGTLVGTLLITVLRNGMNLLALTSSIQVAAIGVLAIAALALGARGQRP